MEKILTNQERNSVKNFRETTGSEKVIEDEPTDSSYAESVLWSAALKKRKTMSGSKYRSTNHVSPATNIVERANSQAKLIMSDRRQTLYMLMILKPNKTFWPTEKIIQEDLDSDDLRNPEQESDSDEEEDC